ncbi:MAG: hypothetical protein FD174_317 [Geobacteraceae bacterium]|nr:MAG: hypothetical protein FD174_317 [Geobacteraceae bacterium]
MMIPVLYTANSSGTVKDQRLDELIAKGRIVAFRRSNGWVDIKNDPVRGKGGGYHGPERRKRGEKAAKLSGFFG